MGRQRHYWQASKKREGANNNKSIKFITKLYPYMKQDEIELLAEINSVADLKATAKDMGMSDQDIKKELG